MYYLGCLQPQNTNPFAEDVATEELKLKIEENARLQREVTLSTS